MKMSLKQAQGRRNEGEEELTLEERAELAEIRFKAICSRVVKREGLDKYDSETDFIEHNVMKTSKHKLQDKLDKI